MKKFLHAALLGMGGLAASAHASVYSIGELPSSPTVYSHTASVTGSSFSDTYLFSVSSLAETASASAVSLSLLNLLDIDKLVLSLLDSGGKVLASASDGDYATLNDVLLNNGQSYAYLVTGDITGSSGGVYTLLATSVASDADKDTQSTDVPEPASLMLSGIGLLAAGLARRGQQRDQGTLTV